MISTFLHQVNYWQILYNSVDNLPAVDPNPGNALTESQEEVQRENADNERNEAQQLQDEIEKAHANDPKDR